MAENRNGHKKAASQKNGQKPAQKNAHKNGQGEKREPNRARHSSAVGTLFVIGGGEDRQEMKVILRNLAERIGSGKLVVSTLASEYGDEVWEDYHRIFASLGVKHIKHLGMDDREESVKDHRLDVLAGATAVFFTGGDQLKITTRLGGTALSDRIVEIYKQGGIIAGTSAGATALGDVMLVGSLGERMDKVGSAFQMIPGLGLARDLIIDQHFSERGRIRRLLGAVAQNPRMVGVGIDEDTAIVIEKDKQFQTLGSGAVYVVDGHDLSHTNISEHALGRAMSIFDVKLHVLSSGDGYDLKSRQPLHPQVEKAKTKMGRQIRIEKAA